MDKYVFKKLKKLIKQKNSNLFSFILLFMSILFLQYLEQLLKTSLAFIKEVKN